jgi:hypothetical protein
MQFFIQKTDNQIFKQKNNHNKSFLRLCSSEVLNLALILRTPFFSSKMIDNTPMPPIHNGITLRSEAIAQS